MEKIILTILIGAGAIQWMASVLGSRALVHYMRIKGYTLPTDEELKVCTRYALQHLFKKDQYES